MFKETWKDKRARVGNLITMTIRARAGEILALRISDVATDRLHIHHSWSRDDRLKSTKTGEERSVPLLPNVRSELRELIESNPFGKDSELFIFYGPDRSAPMSHNTLRRGLAEALVDVTLNKRDRKKASKRAEV